MADQTPIDPVASEQAAAWNLSAEEVDRLLATEDDHRLRLIFGTDYDELRELAREASLAVRGEGDPVLIVPGILGSSLGTPGNFLTRNTIWFDPVSLTRGEAMNLRLTAAGNSAADVLGVVPVAHTFLRLRLKRQGYDVRYFAYDWRQSIAVSGKRLATFVRKLKPDTVHIVAHSMGGLVSRAALKVGMPNIGRVVMLGTPNRGSFSPVEVLQGINSNVKLVAKLDVHHDAEELTKKVFSTFPSVYEMLPRPEVFDGIDLFDRTDWPSDTLRPSQPKLDAAQQTWTKLVDDHQSLRLIAGYNQKTVTSLTADQSGRFLYAATTLGDGTVPLTFCELSGVPTRYVQESHTGLLRDRDVARAVGDLLQSGQTSRLEEQPNRNIARSDARPETFRQSDFEREPNVFSNRRGAAIDPDQYALIAETAMSMSSLPLTDALEAVSDRAAVEPRQSMPLHIPMGSRLTADITFDRHVISRDAESQLEVELYHGNIFDAPYRALVLGTFSNVDPAGPAAVLDRMTHGAVSELLMRRMFAGETGKVFVMPTGRNALKADYVVFAGLGEYNRFIADPRSILEMVSRNILKTLMHCGVDEFATVVYGANSGQPIRSAIESFMKGYLEALKGSNTALQSVRFRRVGICEMDAERYAELKDEAFRIGGTDLCRSVRLRLHEAKYPAMQITPVSAPADRATLDENLSLPIVYLAVRVDTDPDEDTRWTVHSTVLTSGGKATVFPSATLVQRDALDAAVHDVVTSNSNNLVQHGEKLKRMVFTQDFIEVLQHSLQPIGPNQAVPHLTIIHDPLASRVPWESLPLLTSQPDTGALPCLQSGVSRRYRSNSAASLAKFLEERQQTSVLSVLLVIDPTSDLPGAEDEGTRIISLLSQTNEATFDVLWQDAATRESILEMMQTGKYDVVHYAGHAAFDAENRERSGLLCAGLTPSGRKSILTGRDLAGLNRLPSLIFFNACETGRIRQRSGVDEADAGEHQSGVAEALLNGGLAQFVGTYWPVGDAPAKIFAERFYPALIEGETVREAVRLGRAGILEVTTSRDLANYMHYGAPMFRVKVRRSDRRSR